MTSKQSESLDDIPEDDPPKKTDKGTGSWFFDTASAINYKLLILLFILFLLITSDIVTDKILSNVDGATNFREVTTKGSLIQGVGLVGLYVLGDIAIRSNIV